MNQKFMDVYRRDDDVLRMALMEKEWGNPRTRVPETQAVQQIRSRRNVVVAVGNRIVTNSFDRWVAELSRIDPDVHVYWVHTKFMLVDPLGPRPAVVTGSGNFSKASTDTNDENMLVIRGDKRIADIYFGEYLRLYTHYAFRESVRIYTEKKQHGSPDDWKPQFLVDDDSWMAPYFDAHDRSARDTRRKYFGGPMSVSDGPH
jgi:phosphatidylserine/phosphatidylglycerophosphate/cardiolipin synthase-like enzyme